MTLLDQLPLQKRIDEAVRDWMYRPWSPGWEPLRIAMTFEEYLEVTTLPHDRFEYEAGEAIEMPGVDLLHSELHDWLQTLLSMWVRRRKLGRVIPAGYVQPTSERSVGRIPDISFVSTERLSVLGTKQYEGPADLVVEIVSPGSRTIDRRVKFREYAEAGVREYWILDPHRKLAEFFVLEKGAFVPAEGEESAYASSVIPGVVLEPAWLWDQPPVDEILDKWAAGQAAKTAP